jgi:hypothetical protein
MKFQVVVGLTFLAAMGCGGGSGNGGPAQTTTLEGDTFCERYASLAEAKGCVPNDGCELQAECQDVGIAWVNCVATDLDQCICESDGDLNCEGSWKDNEGPALCVDEYSVANACND